MLVSLWNNTDHVDLHSSMQEFNSALHNAGLIPSIFKKEGEIGKIPVLLFI